jgi:hypothetical protein
MIIILKTNDSTSRFVASREIALKFLIGIVNLLELKYTKVKHRTFGGLSIYGTTIYCLQSNDIFSQNFLN